MPDLVAFGTWLSNVLLYVPRKIWEMMSDSLVELIDWVFLACTVCDFASLNDQFLVLPIGVLWILSWFKVGSGMTMIFTGYAVRFLIRRIPWIG